MRSDLIGTVFGWALFLLIANGIAFGVRYVWTNVRARQAKR